METSKTTKERDELYKFVHGLRIYMVKLKEVYDQTNIEFENALEHMYSRIREPDSRSNRNFQCRKCGCSTFHKSSDCLAKRYTKCLMCGKSNHLTVACEKGLIPVPISDFTLNLLNRLDREAYERKAALKSVK